MKKALFALIPALGVAHLVWFGYVNANSFQGMPEVNLNLLSLDLLAIPDGFSLLRSTPKACNMTVPSAESVQCLVDMVRSKSFEASTLFLPSHLAWLSHATGITTELAEGPTAVLLPRPYKSISDHVVLDIPCSEEELSVATLMDLVPGYTNKLTVLLSSACASQSTILPDWTTPTAYYHRWITMEEDDKHERRLRSFLYRAFPATDVMLVACTDDTTPNTTTCVDHMVAADLLVCARPSMACMVAATVTSINAATVVVSAALYPWLTANLVQEEPSLARVKVYDEAAATRHSRCNHMRGRLGT
jgi:hypothetical protein